jgi:hypothetical protein
MLIGYYTVYPNREYNDDEEHGSEDWHGDLDGGVLRVGGGGGSLEVERPWEALVHSLISPLTSPHNKVILQYMKNTTKFETAAHEVRPLPFHTWHGEKWEVTNTVEHNLTFFVHLTDALMYAENVDSIDELSREARQYWNMVAMS